MRREDEQDAELDAQDRELIDRVRALPAADGAQEPDWSALERQIRGALPAEVPRPWWRRWQWLLPVGTLAVAAAAVLLWLHRAEPVEQARPVSLPQLAAPTEPALSMWLGGQVVDVDDLDAALPDDLDDLDADDHDALATDQGAADIGDILPAGDPGWIDSLDEAALDRAETFLANKKG